MKVFNIAGFVSCDSFIEAKQALLGLQTIFPTEYLVHVIECKSMIFFYYIFLKVKNFLSCFSG